MADSAIDRVHIIADYMGTLLRHVWSDLDEAGLLYFGPEHPNPSALADVMASLGMALELVAELNSLDYDPAVANCRN
jgi:hypothetical protein